MKNLWTRSIENTILQGDWVLTTVWQRLETAEAFILHVWSIDNDLALWQDCAAMDLVVRLCPGVVIVQPSVAAQAHLGRDMVMVLVIVMVIIIFLLPG